jgi:hypothetical protein
MHDDEIFASLHNITAPRVISTVVVSVQFIVITFNLPLLYRSRKFKQLQKSLDIFYDLQMNSYKQYDL